MKPHGSNSERVLVLAPLGRDAAIAVGLLKEAGYEGTICPDIQGLVRELERGAAVAVMTDEAILTADLKPLARWVDAQPAWSDLPIVLLTQRGGGPERNPVAAGLSDVLGSVTFIERPSHPVTLISVVRTALRARRRQYEARLRLEELSESEQRLQTALKAGRLGSWRLNLRDEVLMVSESSKSHFGLGPDDRFDYARWQASTHPEDSIRVQQALARSIEAGDDYSIEYRNVWPDGSIHWVDLRARAIRNGDGRVESLVGVSTDITARKMYEIEREKLLNELARERAALADLNETLEQRVLERTAALSAEVTAREKAQEQLRQAQKMEAVGQLTGGIAHDFNNLLQGIVGSLDLIGRRIAQGRVGELAKLLSGAMASANRAASLTHRLLAFSRRQPLDPKALRVNPLVASMEELLRRTLKEHINLELRVGDDVWPTLCDANQLESAILNLAINARDAMPDGGQLVIETFNTSLDRAQAELLPDVRPGDYVCIAVSDTGCGMTPEVIERAFDPFFTTKPLGQGTGLGLSQIYGFTRQSGGGVRIQSREGHGTTVRLYLPRYTGEMSVVEESSDTAPARHGEGEVVLVVEDEPVVRSFIVQVLKDLGYIAVEAHDGPSGLQRLLSMSRIDLLITDVGLPGLNGRQLADAARTHIPGLKVLFMTGYAQTTALRNGVLEPGMEMIMKPVPMDVLAIRVKKMIEGHTLQPAIYRSHTATPGQQQTG